MCDPHSSFGECVEKHPRSFLMRGTSLHKARDWSFGYKPVESDLVISRVKLYLTFNRCIAIDYSKHNQKSEVTTRSMRTQWHHSSVINLSQSASKVSNVIGLVLPPRVNLV